MLFRGHQGTLAVELWKEEHRKLRGSLAPVFYTPAGEMKQFPQIFDEAIKKITGALSCLGCRHAHISVAGTSAASAPVQEKLHGRCVSRIGDPSKLHLSNAQTRAHFMYMGHAGDIVLYKHCDTRRYLNIHAGTGCFFRYVDGQYVEVDREWALQHVGG